MCNDKSSKVQLCFYINIFLIYIFFFSCQTLLMFLYCANNKCIISVKKMDFLVIKEKSRIESNVFYLLKSPSLYFSNVTG